MESFAANNNKQASIDTQISFPIAPWDRTAFILHLADTNLIIAQRNAAWCGHGPMLEQDIAITNISLDLLGQARNFYQYAAETINQHQAGKAVPTGAAPTGNSLVACTEDTLAYLRTEREFKNLLLAEQPNGDWGQTILRQYLFSQFQILLYQKLQAGKDVQLAAIAEKAVKEVAYHLRWSGEWVIRLGDGTEESHLRMLAAIEALWPYTGEFFIPAVYENIETMGFTIETLKQPWIEKVTTLFETATLTNPENLAGVFMQTGGKEGIHTEQLGYILAELQYLQRAYPGVSW